MAAHAMGTHKIVKRLKDSGFSDAQAETVTDIMRENREFDLASLVSKQDLQYGLRDLEQRLTIRIGGMIVVATGLLLAANFFA